MKSEVPAEGEHISDVGEGREEIVRYRVDTNMEVGSTEKDRAPANDLKSEATPLTAIKQ